LALLALAISAAVLVVEVETAEVAIWIYSGLCKLIDMSKENLSH